MNEKKQLKNMNVKEKSHKRAVAIFIVFAATLISGCSSDEILNNNVWNGAYTVEDSDYSIVSEVETEGQHDEIESGTVCTVLKEDGVNVRISPQKGSDVIENLSNGEQVTLSGKSYNNWVKISYHTDEAAEEEAFGWVSIKYLNKVSNVASESIESVEETNSVESDKLEGTIDSEKLEETFESEVSATVTNENEHKDEIVHPMKNDMSNDEILQGAKDLLNDLIYYSVNDTEKFNDLFIESSQEEIQNCMDDYTEIYYKQDTKQIVQIGLSMNPYYYVEICFYTVFEGEILPSSRKLDDLIMCFTNEGWKVSYSAIVRMIFYDPENFDLKCPEEVINASNSGRNESLAEYSFLLNNTTVFEGCLDICLGYMYQNEDGSVDACIYMSNGTENDIEITEITLVATDKVLGEILNQTIHCFTSVSSGYTEWRIWHFEPSQVLTGTQSWSNVHIDVDFKYLYL